MNFKISHATPDNRISSVGPLKNSKNKSINIRSSNEPKERVNIGSPPLKDNSKTTSPSNLETSRSTSLKHDEKILRDGFDPARDIVAIESKEGKPNEPYKFKVNVSHLKPGAEKGNLDLYTLVSLVNKQEQGNNNLPDGFSGTTSQPWNLAIGAYDNQNFKAIDSNSNQIPGAVESMKFNSLTNSVEFSVNKNILRQQGWQDGQPLKLQAFTAKDYLKQATDSLDDFSNKPWKKDGNLTRSVDTSSPSGLNVPRDPNWADDSIYFVLTDRFNDADPTNNHAVQKGDLTKYQGGDLQGIIDKLDYIKDLGVSSIWISPTMANQEDFFGTSGYHGYWPIDFMDVDKHQGDMSKFKELVNKSHEKGLKVLLDIPFNQVAWENPLAKDPSKQGWFHQIGDIQDWNDPYQVENGSLMGLPDLAQENPEVYNYLLDVSKFWIKEGNIDGFRLDAIKHVPKSFWDKFSQDIKDIAGPDFMLLGEHLHGDVNIVHKYQEGGLASMFDFPLYYTIRDTIAHDGSMKVLGDRIKMLNSKYQDPSMISSFIDNHDFNRFMTETGPNGKDKLKLALAFSTTINRIPMVYYGTESAMEGRAEIFGQCDYENRDMMKFNADPDMEAFTKKLFDARNNSIALKEGSYQELWQDDKVLGYTRYHSDQEAVVLLNNDYHDQYREVPMLKDSKLKDGTILKDALSGREVTVSNGKVKVNLTSKEPMILLPKDK